MVEQLEHGYSNGTVKQELSGNIKTKIIEHRDNYYQYLISHYAEIILNLRKYRKAPASLDTIRIEYLLRSGYQVIIGQNRAGYICLLGYANAFSGNAVPFNESFLERYVDPKQITWTVPKNMIPIKPQPIRRENGATTGDYICITNKSFSFVNDFQTVEMYAQRIAEIQASRFSLIMQSKISTVFQFENGDETANQLIEDIYNGAGFVKVDNYVQPDRQIMHVGGQEVISALETLKTAYKEEVDELNNQLGINSVGIQKASGVSAEESDSNNEYVQTATAIYLTPINRQFALLNKRFGTKIYAYMNTLESGAEKPKEEQNENN